MENKFFFTFLIEAISINININTLGTIVLHFFFNIKLSNLITF